jgi:hypothetical protein
MGATHFLMKTLPRVASEMALHVLAYNLTRVMNIMGIGPLMAAQGIANTSRTPALYASWPGVSTRPRPISDIPVKRVNVSSWPVASLCDTVKYVSNRG